MNQCIVCLKEITDSMIAVRPTRHLTSPNPAPRYEVCSRKCEEKFNEDKDKMYAFYAALDKNASDSECFEGSGWDGIFRVGSCKITGAKVRVEPLMPSDRSGQPQECSDHFILRKKYRDLLPKDSIWV